MASLSPRLSSQKLPRNLSATLEHRYGVNVAFSFVSLVGSRQKPDEVGAWGPLLHLPISGLLHNL